MGMHPGNGPMHDGGMDMPLLPHWLRVGWAVVFAAVLVLHLRHARSMSGQARWWHAGHTLMAGGMLGMYLLPRSENVSLYVVGSLFFGAFTAAAGGAAVMLWRREGVLNLLWVTSAVDMFAMVVMLLSPAARPATLSRVLVCYLAVQAVAWACGLWARVPALSASAVRSAVTAAPATLPVDGEPPGPAPVRADALEGTARRTGLTPHHTPGIRVSLALMECGMAWMLAVM